MPRNSSGIYTLPAGTIAVTDTPIASSAYNTFLSDLVTAITNSLNVQGTASMQAPLRMAGNAITGLANGAVAADAVCFSQMNTAIAAALSGFTNVPPGTVIEFAGNSVPTGYLSCNGGAVSRTTFSDLFAAIGVTWGVGDGSTTFNVPNDQGTMAVGAGNGPGLSSRTLGQTGGEENHLLVSGEMPSHTHTDTGHGHSVVDPGHVHAGTFMLPGTNGLSGSGSVGNSTGGVSSATTGLTVNTGTANLANTGGGGNHNNMPPFIVYKKCIKT